jgi:hypothetical protein
LTGLPQAVHFEFSKNSGCPQRLFSQTIINDLPHEPHLSSPTKIWPPQYGQDDARFRPHPAHTASPRPISFRQFGQWYPKGLLLAHFAQNLASRSII